MENRKLLTHVIHGILLRISPYTGQIQLAVYNKRTFTTMIRWDLLSCHHQEIDRYNRMEACGRGNIYIQNYGHIHTHGGTTGNVIRTNLFSLRCVKAPWLTLLNHLCFI